MILDRENTKARAAELLATLHGESTCVNWLGGWLDAPQLNDVPGLLKDAPVKPLIVIESLTPFIEGKEDDATDVCKTTVVLRRLTHMGCTVLAICNATKRDPSVRGSLYILDSMDGGYFIEDGCSMGERLESLTCKRIKSKACDLPTELFLTYRNGRFANARQQMSEVA